MTILYGSLEQRWMLFQKNVSTNQGIYRISLNSGNYRKTKAIYVFLQIANSGKPIALYNLDVIISVGYRVKSMHGRHFRIWANSIKKNTLPRDLFLMTTV